MITFRNVYYRYPGAKSDALVDVSLTIEPRRATAIVGSNGAGKSTLVKLCNGLLKPVSGSVMVDGVDTIAASVAKLARNVGIVFQNPSHQIFAETVEDEVAFALKNFGYPHERWKEMVDYALSRTGLEKQNLRSPFTLSSGERKRLSIASILVYAPSVLVLDEPTVAQDLGNRKAIGSIIREYCGAGNTVIAVTHDMEFASKYFDKLVVLNRGGVVASGKPQEILANEQIVSKSNLITPDSYILSNYLAKHGLGLENGCDESVRLLVRRLCP
ncbi:MAG: energy-coupling factor ABC transporter ATP-binding protein [Candidatus Marsarchaeota archaeon]|nr:energy-coupling factor ABC transporter ATP-binding protein [Candidatus Marsarchaeota archaeon]